MTVDTQILLEILAKICQEKGLKAAVTETFKGGAITGVAAIVGGLLLGRVGIAIGGVIGALGAAAKAKEFQPVALILRDLPPSKKRELYNHVQNAFRDFGVHDVALVLLLQNNTSFHELAASAVKGFLQQEMKMTVRQ